MTRYKLCKLRDEVHHCMIRADDGIYYSVGEVDREVERICQVCEQSKRREINEF